MAFRTWCAATSAASSLCRNKELSTAGQLHRRGAVRIPLRLSVRSSISNSNRGGGHKTGQSSWFMRVPAGRHDTAPVTASARGNRMSSKVLLWMNDKKMEEKSVCHFQTSATTIIMTARNFFQFASERAAFSSQQLRQQQKEVQQEDETVGAHECCEENGTTALGSITSSSFCLNKFKLIFFL